MSVANKRSNDNHEEASLASTRTHSRHGLSNHARYMKRYYRRLGKRYEHHLNLKEATGDDMATTKDKAYDQGFSAGLDEWIVEVVNPYEPSTLEHDRFEAGLKDGRFEARVRNGSE